MRQRRKPIVLTSRILLQIYRAKRNGCTALGICQQLNAPYLQIFNGLHPKLNLCQKVAGPPQRSSWSHGTPIGTGTAVALH
jgi:hypothetical protein